MFFSKKKTKENVKETRGYLYSSRDLKKLIGPLVVEQYMAITIGMLDTMMVSVVSESAVSGVSLVDAIFILLINVFTALGTGGAVIAGRYLGQKKPEQGCEVVDQLVIFTAVASVAIMALLYACKYFVLNVVFGAIDAEVEYNCNVYLMITSASIPFIACYNSCAALFRAMNDSKTPMKISILMNAVHIIGNAVLLYVFRMGVEGVAVPTLFSRVLAALCMLLLLKNQKNELHFSEHFQFRLKKDVLKSILYIGIPNSLENSMFQLGKILVLSFVSGMGTYAITANAIGNAMNAMAVVPGISMGFALLAVVSQCVGAGDYEQVKYYTKKIMKWEYGVIIATNICIISLLPVIMKLYHASSMTADAATKIMIMHAVMACLIWPISFTLPNTLRASGDVIFTMAAAIVSMWVFRVICARVIGVTMGVGVIGVWIAMFIDWIFRSMCFTVRYKKGKWKTKA